MVLSGNYRQVLLSQNDLDPFWIGELSESDKKARLELFMAKTYPIWGKMIQDWEATFDQPKSKSDMEVIHAIEMGIAASGVQVDRLSVSWSENKGKRQKTQDQYQRAME